MERGVLAGCDGGRDGDERYARKTIYTTPSRSADADRRRPRPEYHWPPSPRGLSHPQRLAPLLTVQLPLPQTIFLMVHGRRYHKPTGLSGTKGFIVRLCLVRVTVPVCLAAGLKTGEIDKASPPAGGIDQPKAAVSPLRSVMYAVLSRPQPAESFLCQPMGSGYRVWHADPSHLPGFEPLALAFGAYDGGCQ